MEKRLFIVAILTLSVMSLIGTSVWAGSKEAGAPEHETGKSLYLIYWELNPELSSKEHLQAAKKVMDAGLFPPKGVKVLLFSTTPDQWGVTVVEADSAESAYQVVSVWRLAGDGFFKVTKVGPAIPVPRAMELSGQALQAIGAAEAKAAAGRK